MVNLPGSGRELEGGAHLPGSAGKHLVLSAAPRLAFTRTGTREAGLWRMEMVAPKAAAEVSASVCVGTGPGEVCVHWPELEASSDSTSALGVPFCLLFPFKGVRGH